MNIYTSEMTGVEWVEIEVAPNEFSAMPKAVYDEMIANQQAQQQGANLKSLEENN